MPNWDNTSRSGKNGLVFHRSTPSLFGHHLKDAMNFVKGNNRKHKLLIIKSWNEWAEGNYLEPDLQWGRQYLDVIKETIQEIGKTK